MIITPQFKLKESGNALYLVSTPIGNLEDITLRAIRILGKSDYILCEDTRLSKNLLNKYQIKSKLIAYHKFNEKKNLAKIIENLKSGKIISLISDAGTPCISDPGSILINECIKNNIKVIPVPGPSSAITAVSVSGFSDKFLFYGFFPETKNHLSNEFKKLSENENTLVFFVSAKKINKFIPVIKNNFTGRKIVICREITKIYEQFTRKNVDDLELFEEGLKGELTIVISEKKSDKKVSQKLNESDKSIIRKMVNKLPTKDVVDIISQVTNVSRKEIYSHCLKLKNEN